NNGNGTFTDVTKEAGLLHSKPEWGAGCTFTDYNRDGFLDLFVSTYLNFDLKTVPLPGANADCNWKGIAVNCGPRGLPTGRNFLYRNNGDGTFTDVSESSGIAKVDHRYAMAAVAVDFDDDGWPDIFVACDSTPSILYHNNREGTFTDIALEAGVAYNEDGREQAGMGVAFADFDNDGFLDLLFVNGSVYPELEQFFPEYKYKNPRIVLRNRGSGEFENVSARSGTGISDRHSSRGCAFGDFDNDGMVDVAIMNMGEPPTLLRNQTSNSNRWLKLK